MLDLRTLNISGTLSVFLLFARPSLCIPQATIRNFNELPLPINRLFEKDPRFGKVNVRAVVLDKDDCFAWPETSEVWPDYKVGAL
jgi:phosphatidylglycerophosphatase GEP4